MPVAVGGAHPAFTNPIASAAAMASVGSVAALALTLPLNRILVTCPLPPGPIALSRP